MASIYRNAAEVFIYLGAFSHESCLILDFMRKIEEHSILYPDQGWQKLSVWKDSQASDARDKIYALLSISSDAFDTDHLRPGYEKTIGEAIHDTVAYMISYHGCSTVITPFMQWGPDDLV